MSTSLSGFSARQNELQLNTMSTGNQTMPVSTALSDGRAVAIWRSDSPSDDTTAVYGQITGPSGDLLGEQFLISEGFDNAQAAEVTALDDGGFAVTWKSNTETSPFGTILVQRFDAEGAAVGKTISVSNVSDTVRANPVLSEAADGSLTVIWQSLDQDGSNWGLYSRQIDAAGVLSTNEVRINATTLNAQGDPSIISLQDGRQVVSWYSFAADGTTSTIKARFLDTDGLPTGAELALTQNVSGQRSSPALAPLSDGGFAAVWQDSAGGTVSGRVFDSAGAASGTVFQVDTAADRQAQNPQVAAVPTGGFFVVYQAEDSTTGSVEIYGQLFGTDGQKIGTVEQINTFAASVQSAPDIDILATGDALVTWQSNTQDGDGYGIFGQVLALNQPTTGTVGITGITEELQTLTAVPTLDDGNGLGTLLYRWYRDGDLFQETPSETYELTQADVGASISVAVAHTDQDGFVDLIQSDPTDSIANVNDQSTGAPIITGELRVGQVLAADVSSLEDSDGIANVEYFWRMGETLLPHATGKNFYISEEYFGQTIAVDVRLTDTTGVQSEFGVQTKGVVQEAPRELLLSNETETEIRYSDEPEAVIRIDNKTAFIVSLSGTGMSVAMIDLKTGAEVAHSDETQDTAPMPSSLILSSGSTGERAYLIYQDPSWNSDESPAPDVYLRIFTAEDNEIAWQDVILGPRSQGPDGFLREEVHTLTTETLLVASGGVARIVDIGAVSPSVSTSFEFTSGVYNLDSNAILLGNDYYAIISSSAPYYTYSSQFELQIRSLAGDYVKSVDLGSQNATRGNSQASADTVYLQRGEDGLVFLDVGPILRNDYGTSEIRRITFDITTGEVVSVLSVPPTDREDPSPDYLDDPDLEEDGFILEPTVVETESGEYRLVIQSYELNAAPEGLPEILGTALQGNTLLADASLVSDENGLTDISYSWWRDGVRVESANADTYELTQRDVGHEITVMVSYTDGEGRVEHVFSAPSTPVADVNDAPIGGLFIYETASGAMSVYTMGLQDPDGLGVLSIQWLRNGAPIYGATESEYLPTAQDTDQALSVSVSYTDGQGNPENLIGRELATTLGTESGDGLTGTVSAEALIGLDGPDTLVGVSGSDYLIGGNGNDWLSGEGTAAASYGITVANQVFRLYQSALDRLPDPTGHAAWSERLATGEFTLLQVAEGFVNSPQFRSTYQNLGDAAFVELLYQNVLGRPSDAAGLARWTGDLQDGSSRAEVLLGFSQSPQFVAETNEDATNFALRVPAADWSDEIYRLYQATLDREPDITGFQNWTARLGSGMDLDDVVAGFVKSPEFQSTYGSLNDADFVTLLYNNVMGRAPDEAGFARWTTDLANGASREEVVRGFSQSPEFINATEDALEDWMRGHGTDDVLDGGAGDNVLFGGLLSDTFIFDASQPGSHRVLDLEAWDSLDFRGFGYESDAEAIAHMTQEGADVIFEDQGTTVTLVGVQLESLSDDMIL